MARPRVGVFSAALVAVGGLLQPCCTNVTGSCHERVTWTGQSRLAAPVPRVEVDLWLRSLADVVAECVPRVDSPHPVFHGCLDWHSAVHGNYALRAFGRIIGDENAIALAESQITPNGVVDEIADYEAGSISHELPYGLSWLLVLDREANTPTLALFAGIIAPDLEDWVRRSIRSRDAATNGSYQNLGFAVFALHQWFTVRDPPAARSLRAATAETLVSTFLSECSSTRATALEGFLDACYTMGLAIADFHLAAPSEATLGAIGPLVEFLLTTVAIGPSEFTTIHSAGLNFSRAWTLYHSSRAAHDRRLVGLGDRLVASHLEFPAYWRDDYERYAHWIPQFGVLALALRHDAIEPPADLHGQWSPGGRRPPPADRRRVDHLEDLAVHRQPCGLDEIVVSAIPKMIDGLDPELSQPPGPSRTALALDTPPRVEVG